MSNPWFDDRLRSSDTDPTPIFEAALEALGQADPSTPADETAPPWPDDDSDS